MNILAIIWQLICFLSGQLNIQCLPLTTRYRKFTYTCSLHSTSGYPSCNIDHLVTILCFALLGIHYLNMIIRYLGASLGQLGTHYLPYIIRNVLHCSVREGFQKKTPNYPHFVNKHLTPPPFIHVGRS